MSGGSFRQDKRIFLGYRTYLQFVHNEIYVEKLVNIPISRHNYRFILIALAYDEKTVNRSKIRHKRELWKSNAIDIWNS